jgi:diguanylate cyclase (GGDEF)-like protein
LIVMPVSASLTTHVDTGLVALSVAVAIVASYAALDLTRRSSDAAGSRKRLWIAGGGVTMGVGIWSMHFIGMLAWSMSMPVSYDDALVGLSLLAAVLGSSVSLMVVTRPHLSRRGLLSAAAFMGFAVAGMHYLGMASMEMPATVHWKIALVVLSVAIGLVASLIALSLFLRIRQSSDGFGFARRAAAAVLLGFGVAGLHYTAMEACTFTAAMGHTSAPHGFTTNSLVVMLALAAGVMLAVLIGGAALDQRRAALASDITVVANIARELCRVGDTRGRICQAVQQLTTADYVTLLEADEHGSHTTTASIGIVQDPRFDSTDAASLPESISPTGPHNLTSGLGDLDEITIGVHQLAEDETVHHETLMVDGRYVGILAAGWHGRARRLSDRTRTLLGMVAAEAAVAIDRERLLSRLEYLSRRDELTGLLNRRVLGEEFGRELAIASRHDRPLCVVMLDLDHFKGYNDAHGHQAGDQLLESAAAAWLTALRSTDLIARYGGEEFIVILSDCDLNDAVSTADRLREAVPDGATCSAGVAILERLDTATQLIGRADHALYHAKASGRNRTSTTHLTTHSAIPS